MSLESWKAEFYPTDAKEFAGSQDPLAAAEHSLKKWQGLLPENLEKHGVAFIGYYVADKDDFSYHSGYQKPLPVMGRNSLSIDCQSCSLCHYTSFCKTGACKKCPIVLATERDCIGTYSRCVQKEDADNNPSKMIALLEKAVNHLKLLKASQPCCNNESRNMNGGCDNCGDPCL